MIARTEMRAHLLWVWRATAGDPDWAVTRWLTADGVPTGLRRHPEDCGIISKTNVFAGQPLATCHTVTSALHWRIRAASPLVVWCWKLHRACGSAPEEGQTICSTVRGDFVAMLTLVVNMRPRTRQLWLFSQAEARKCALFLWLRGMGHTPGCERNGSHQYVHVWTLPFVWKEANTDVRTFCAAAASCRPMWGKQFSGMPAEMRSFHCASPKCHSTPLAPPVFVYV